MKVGMLWFDDDEARSLAEKVERAAAYYRQKYGEEPDTCYVNPAMLEVAEARVNGVVVRAAQTVLQNYFWVGVEDVAGEVDD